MNPEEIQKLITKWNPHFQNTSKGRWHKTVPRKAYLERLVKAVKLKHIIVLTGVRRSGKSTLMHQLMGELIEQGVKPTNILYLQLEDVLIGKYLPQGAELLEKIYNFYLEKYNPKERVYLFLDELQGVKDFNRWLYSKYEAGENIKFVISGSRRSLIESETASVLTGRTVQFDIYPFNFYEYLTVKKVELKIKKKIADLIEVNFDQTNTILHHLGNFLFAGGYPEIILTKDKENQELIANAYYRDILTRDIIVPNNIRNPKEIEVLGLQILSDFTKTHTLRSLSRPQKISIDTVKTYLDYFYRSYLFFESRFFSYKTKETQDIQRPKKIYVIDNGLRNFNSLTTRKDLGQCAENAVYLELKKNNKAVYYWKGQKEVDFAVLGKNLKLYNVSYTNEPDQREVEGLIESLKEFNLKKGTIITKNYFAKTKVGNKTIEFIPLWAWLIGQNFAQI